MVLAVEERGTLMTKVVETAAQLGSLQGRVVRNYSSSGYIDSVDPVDLEFCFPGVRESDR